jgi:N-acetylmuramoyl-L-alanine amidase
MQGPSQRTPKYEHTFTVLAFSTLLGLIYFIISVGVPNALFSDATHSLASIFFIPSITVGELQAKSVAADHGVKKIHILIVPGHEPDYGGAEYRDLKERNIVVKIAKELKKLLENNPRYDVTVTRDENAWSQTFKDYFTAQWATLPDWIGQHHSEMNTLLNDGKIVRATDKVYHNTPPSDVVRRLYAINKWVDENNIDITIHIHVNDNPRPDTTSPGEYSGFTIYVPDHQYSNADASHHVAEDVFSHLSTFFPVSNLDKESSGVVEDQDLIAVGSYNTVDAVSLLIEYGYIYEPVFANEHIQDLITKEMAFQTYLGVQDFFGKPNDVTLTSNTLTLPYRWDSDMKKTSTSLDDVFALQIALASKGYYPPQGKTKNECEMSGIFGGCTWAAVLAFDKDHAITEEGYVGPKTRAVLNALFSGVNI